MPRARTLGDFLVPGMVNLSIEKALVVLKEQCYRTQESQVLAERVLNRALYLRQEVENKPVGTRIQSDVILRFGELVGRTIQFLRRYASKTLVARVAANRRFLERLLEVHGRLDSFFEKVYLASRPEMTEWKTCWASDVELQQRLLEGFLSNNLVVNGEFTERELEESLTEVKFELANRELTATLKALMERMFDQFRHYNSYKLFLPLPVPIWFVARDEVQYAYEPFAVGSYGALHRGLLERSKTKVVVKCMYSDSKQTQAALHSEGQLWIRLDHPNVLKMKGGCYVGSPMFFLCEDAGDDRSFPDFFAASPKNKGKLWSLFLEAIDGLEYLHNNGIVHNNLKGSNLLVGVDGRAKVCDFGFSYDKKDPTIETPKKQTTASRWKAPELLLESSDEKVFPTFASDIYSLGMCMIEAVTGGLPWGRSTPDHSSYGGLHRGLLERNKTKAIESELEQCHALIAQELRDAKRLCGLAGVFQGLSDQVQRRLTFLLATLRCSRLDVGAAARLAAAQALNDVVGRFVAFLERATRQEALYRFASSRAVIGRVRSYHEELDHLLSEHAAALAFEAPGDAHNWLDFFEKARENMWIKLDELSRDRVALQRDLPDEQDQQTALMYITYECKRPTGTYTPSELQVMQNAFNTITRFSRAKVPELPRWFLPPYDVDIEAETARKPPPVESQRGTLGNAPVTTKFVRAVFANETLEVFKHAVSAWYDASQECPHLVRLYGASHVGDVSYVAEDVTGASSLRDFVASKPQRLWEALFGAAQALQALHNHGLSHSRLDANSVVVTADGTAKITDNIVSLLGLFEPSGGSNNVLHANAWGLDGDRRESMFASDVLAFAGCIVDALGGSVVSSGRDVTDLFRSQPDAVTAEQWGLVQRMCSERPDDRPSIADIVAQFGAFADAERTQREAGEASVRKG